MINDRKMEIKNTEATLKALARQLSCPSGDEGIEMGSTMNTGNIGMTLATIEQLYLKDKESVLELGHGNCGHLSEILKQAENLNYTGLEVSETMQLQAKELNHKWIEAQEVVFDCYDGTNLPFKEATFDKVMTVNTIYFWEDAKQLIREITRVLKPKGLFIVTFAQKAFMEKLPFTQYGFQLYEEDELVTLAHEADLQLIEIVSKTESAISKTGESVQRPYSIMSFMKMKGNPS